MPTITLGMYSTDSRVRLSCPNSESVIEYSSCIVPQCTTSEAAVIAADRPNSVSTPAAAARRESPSHVGSGQPCSSLRPVREPTPSTAPIPCTASTEPNARSAFGVCSSVNTDAASWMTARAIAAISSGPPSADATIQRITNQERVSGVARAVVRAVPQTIASTGSSGSTESSRPPIVTGTWCTPSHMLAMAPNAPVVSLFAATS